MSFLDDFDFDNEDDLSDKIVDDMWITRDGKIIKIQNMENKHLVNAIKYLRKKAAVEVVKLSQSSQGGRYVKLKPSDLFPSYKKLVDELKRRVTLQEKLKAMVDSTQIKVRKLDL